MLKEFKVSFNYIDKDFQNILNIKENSVVFIDETIEILTIKYHHIHHTGKQYWFSDKCFIDVSLYTNKE